MMTNPLRGIAVILLFVLVMLSLIAVYQKEAVSLYEIPYSEFIEILKEGRINPQKPIIISGKVIKGEFFLKENGISKPFKTYMPFDDPDLIKLLKEKHLQFMGEQEEGGSFLKSFYSFLPWILLLGFLWILMIRQVQATGTRAFSFGKSRAKLISNKKHKVTFEDVAGVEEAKEELKEIIEFLKDRQKFKDIGARIPKGVLLIGPPGTGKTLLAKAVAGEADVPFFSISGSDFVELFVGVGASRVRDLFEQGKKNAPCIIFIDEIGAVGRLRGAGLGGGHDEREQTLNQLLVEMDGFDSNEGIIVMAATNRPDILDPALLRPGRFDRRIVVDIPDYNGRLAILKVHTKKVPLSKDVNLEVLAKSTPGFSGADLANLVNEAALLAARRDRKKVTMEDFEEAKDKVLMGPERKSLFITPEEKKITAYHEAGHALLGKLLPKSDPVHKVTIIPRGRALGLTQQLPTEDRHTRSKEYLLNKIKVLLGGRIAEEIFFEDITNGAGNDLEVATEIAKKMVCEWGMSEKIGPITLGKHSEEVFIGRELVQKRDISEEMAKSIDMEIKRIVEECYQEAKKIILENKDKLQRIADALLKKEVLSADEIDRLIAGETVEDLMQNASQPVYEVQKENNEEEKKEGNEEKSDKG